VASPEFGSVFRSANYKVNLITSIIGRTTAHNANPTCL
jgi:hypothetical protein